MEIETIQKKIGDSTYEIQMINHENQYYYSASDIAKIFEYGSTKCVTSLADNNNKIKLDMTNIVYKKGSGKSVFINKEGIKNILIRTSNKNISSIALSFDIELTENLIEEMVKQKLGDTDYEIQIINNEKCIYYHANTIVKLLEYKSSSVVQKMDIKHRILLKEIYDKYKGTKLGNMIFFTEEGLKSLLITSKNSKAREISSLLNIDLFSRDIINEENKVTKTVKLIKQKIGDSDYEVQTIFDGTQIYYNAQEMLDIIGYKDPSTAIRIIDNEYKKHLNEIHDGYTGYLGKTNFITEKGIKQLLIKSRKQKSYEIAKLFKIDICEKIELKEQESIRKIMKAFSHEKMKYQKICGDYRIDLYFKKYRLAIECDEHGHRNYCDTEEKIRENFLIDHLDCKFVRFNPDIKNFDVFDVISEIHKNMVEICIEEQKANNNSDFE